VPEDDLDFDQVLDDATPPPSPAPVKPAADTAEKAAPATAEKPAAASPANKETAAPKSPVVISQKPGFFGRLVSPLTAKAEGFKFEWSFKTFIIGLALLLLLVLVIENWAAVRLSFLGLHADVPKAIVLLIVFALGYVAALFVKRSKAGRVE